MMTESEFNFVVDDSLLAIEEVLDAAESDLDSENSGGVLTLTCDSGSKVIFTRQAPVRQLWIATPLGGFHFDYVAKHWLRDSDQQPLARFLSDTLVSLADEQLNFDQL
ncbi:MAG: CyaY protein [Motiliproteus sp.]|jgi:CyaY protein